MTEDEVDYYVLIVNSSTGEVEKRMGPMGLSSADCVEDGANINLDHGRYHTEVVTVEELNARDD